MLNAIGALIARQRELESYLSINTNRLILKNLEDEIAEVKSAISILRIHANSKTVSNDSPPLPPKDRVLREDGDCLVPPKNYRD